MCYCEGDDLEVDNNGAERSLRGVGVAWKNWILLGSDNEGRTAAVLASLIATCERLTINRFSYLCDVFERISSRHQFLRVKTPKLSSQVPS